MARVDKIIKNGKVNTFFFVLTVIIGFYSRQVFLSKLGDEFIGLTATLGSFISFLNLVELGIGTSMGFAMYRSLHDNNHDRINELFSLIGYLYDKIGKIILGLAIILSCFFPIIFDKTSLNLGIIYYVFFVYVVSTLINYFFNYHIMLIQADQKGYIPTSYRQTLHISKIIIQILTLYITNNFFIYITIELISAIIYSVIMRQRVNKEYPWLSFKHAKDNSLLKKNKDLIVKIKQVFVHRIGKFILTSTDNVVIYSFVNLQSVTFVGNYYIIIGSATTLLTNFLSGTTAAVGSLVAENDKKKINKVFWELMSLNHFVGGILVLSLFYGVNPVIGIWLGEKYIMEPHIVYLLLANVFIMKARIPMDEFINAYGLFHDTWAPITESLLNLSVSIILAMYFGIAGVLIGTLVSVGLIALGWKPYFLYTQGFKTSVIKYWVGFITLMFSLCLSFIIIYLIVNNFIEIQSDSWFKLIWSLLKVGLVIIVIYPAIMYLFNTGFRNLSIRFINIFKNFINKLYGHKS